MAIYTIRAWRKDASADEQPLWQEEVTAASVEEAYRLGEGQFLAAHPDAQRDAYTIKAGFGYVEK